MSSGPWITIEPLSPVITFDKAKVALMCPGKVGSYFYLPPFTFAANPAATNYSYIVGQFDYSAGQRFTLKSVPAINIVGGFLCIRWRVGATIYRYSLTNPSGGILYDIFEGEISTGIRFPRYFVIEVWSNLGVSEVTLADMITFETSLRYTPDHCDPFNTTEHYESGASQAFALFTPLPSGIDTPNDSLNFWLGNPAP